MWRGTARLSADDARICAPGAQENASGAALLPARRTSIRRHGTDPRGQGSGHARRIIAGGETARSPAIAADAHAARGDDAPGGRTQNVIWPDTMKVMTLKLLGEFVKTTNASFAERVSYESVVSIRV